MVGLVVDVVAGLSTVCERDFNLSTLGLSIVVASVFALFGRGEFSNLGLEDDM
jgi:hypothetical protein